MNKVEEYIKTLKYENDAGLEPPVFIFLIQIGTAFFEMGIEEEKHKISKYLKERIKKYTGCCASQDSLIYNELNEIHKELFNELAHNTISKNYNYGTKRN